MNHFAVDHVPKHVHFDEWDILICSEQQAHFSEVYFYWFEINWAKVNEEKAVN